MIECTSLTECQFGGAIVVDLPHVVRVLLLIVENTCISVMHKFTDISALLCTLTYRTGVMADRVQTCASGDRIASPDLLEHTEDGKFRAEFVSEILTSISVR